MDIIKILIIGVSLTVCIAAVGVAIYFGLKTSMLCLLGYHRPSLSEMSYNYLTKEISVYCSICQKTVYKIKSENHLTDEQWHQFKRIFE